MSFEQRNCCFHISHIYKRHEKHETPNFRKVSESGRYGRKVSVYAEKNTIAYL